MTHEIIDKIVEFDVYCKTCQFESLTPDDNGDMPEPCNECLTYPTNENSKKPVKWKEKEIKE